MLRMHEAELVAKARNRRLCHFFVPVSGPARTLVPSQARLLFVLACDPMRARRGLLCAWCFQAPRPSWCPPGLSPSRQLPTGGWEQVSTLLVFAGDKLPPNLVTQQHPCSLSLMMGRAVGTGLPAAHDACEARTAAGKGDPKPQGARLCASCRGRIVELGVGPWNSQLFAS